MKLEELSMKSSIAALFAILLPLLSTTASLASNEEFFVDLLPQGKASVRVSGKEADDLVHVLWGLASKMGLTVEAGEYHSVKVTLGPELVIEKATDGDQTYSGLIGQTTSDELAGFSYDPKAASGSLIFLDGSKAYQTLYSFLTKAGYRATCNPYGWCAFDIRSGASTLSCYKPGQLGCRFSLGQPK